MHFPILEMFWFPRGIDMGNKQTFKMQCSKYLIEKGAGPGSGWEQGGNGV